MTISDSLKRIDERIAQLIIREDWKEEVAFLEEVKLMILQAGEEGMRMTVDEVTKGKSLKEMLEAFPVKQIIVDPISTTGKWEKETKHGRH